jgi:hypothetical protein
LAGERGEKGCCFAKREGERERIMFYEKEKWGEQCKVKYK